MATDPILPRIENALLLYEISATRFGYVVAGDPGLVTKMRDGRHLKGIRKKVESALDRIEKEGGL